MERRKKLLLAGLILCIGALWIFHGNYALECNTYTVSSDALPPAFDGYRIAQISDLHNAQMGKDNERLLDMLCQAQPDIIVITGDLVDSRRTNLDVACSFVERALEIAPVYYVSGNHEARIDAYPEFKKSMETAGVQILENEKRALWLGGQCISLLGVEDPSFYTDYLFGDSSSVMDNVLTQLTEGAAGFCILLSHRPELFEVYADHGIHLVLAGHAHGGQFRLPVLGGLIAPNQGFFPEYDAGLFTQGQTRMIVSRGIGNSLLPLRLNNPPELVLVQLACGKSA